MICLVEWREKVHWTLDIAFLVEGEKRIQSPQEFDVRIIAEHGLDVFDGLVHGTGLSEAFFCFALNGRADFVHRCGENFLEIFHGLGSGGCVTDGGQPRGIGKES